MKKKILIALAITVTIISAILIIIIICNNEEEFDWKEEYIMDLSAAYRRQNIQNFSTLVGGEQGFFFGEYMPINLRTPHIDGISVRLYAILTFFRKITGTDLTHSMVLDYLSEEFEEDGQIRIWTNGRHPEIAEYLFWIRVTDNNFNVRAYGDMLFFMHRDYGWANDIDIDFGEIRWIQLGDIITPELIARLNLTEIQNRYIEEGRARVYVDEETGEQRVEFIVREE